MCINWRSSNSREAGIILQSLTGDVWVRSCVFIHVGAFCQGLGSIKSFLCISHLLDTGWLKIPSAHLIILRAQWESNITGNDGWLHGGFFMWPRLWSDFSKIWAVHSNRAHFVTVQFFPLLIESWLSGSQWPNLCDYWSQQNMKVVTFSAAINQSLPRWSVMESSAICAKTILATRFFSPFCCLLSLCTGYCHQQLAWGYFGYCGLSSVPAAGAPFMDPRSLLVLNAQFMSRWMFY